jgi:GABA(A) receptor-associated protein
MSKNNNMSYSSASFTTISPPVLNTQSEMITHNTFSSIPLNVISPSTNVAAAAAVEPSNATNDYLEKLKKSQIILEKYPDRVPIIIQPSPSDRDSYPIDKSKYITPKDLTLIQLQQIIRKRIKFPAEKALFMFINNRIYPITSIIGPLYEEHKNKDGFLYVTYCQESTFGQ